MTDLPDATKRADGEYDDPREGEPRVFGVEPQFWRKIYKAHIGEDYKTAAFRAIDAGCDAFYHGGIVYYCWISFKRADKYDQIEEDLLVHEDEGDAVA